ncbi:MAG: VacB/RNase II family 3'-5' exoribonuclease [Oscillospiraceae bacterium]|nr:VacB/RNase II family 3'-5' exoribonuclease [Oscillospiraceae bacterium]
MPKSKHRKNNNNKKGGKRGKNAKAAVTFKGEILRVMRTHGFVRDVNSDKEFFVSGRDLLGSIPGDIVLFEQAPPSNRKVDTAPLDEAKITRIVSKSENALTGTIVEVESENSRPPTRLGLIPDGFGTRSPLEINSYGGFKLKAGDKVRFVLRSRGERHHTHVVDITHVYGVSINARVCVHAYLEEKNIPVEFPEAVLEEAEIIGCDIDIPNDRTDLRNLPIFTIDGADTKDIDDAVHIERTEGGYTLGVHIADVSHYVTEKSALDEEAFKRGTSVYIADLVVPMLPKELSNGICSLNPKEDRLAFSCIMEVAKSGELKSFEFKKSVIRSRLQGVYSEINAIINDDGIHSEKYAEVIEQIPVMVELAGVLKRAREGRGAPALYAAESKIICGEDGECLDIQKRVGGVSEGIIEEFMLMANNAAARLAMEKKLPFVYRVHEPPAAEKLTRLSETLTALGIETATIKPTAESLSKILTAAKNADKFEIINMAVLRSMMKAKYHPEPLGHFGLVMKEYAHFTSPIRRYPDLAIHRILSAYITTGSVSKKFTGYAGESSLKSSNAELRAVNAERDCNGFYAAEYMSSHVGEEFDGVISGVTERGFFVMLDNTVEGRVPVSYESEFKLDNNVALANSVTGVRYMLGDKVRVKCSGVNVPMGLVDFEVV